MSLYIPSVLLCIHLWTLWCGQNVLLSDDGTKLIYFIAAVVVVFDYKERTQRFFTRHNDDITTYVVRECVYTLLCSVCCCYHLISA